MNLIRGEMKQQLPLAVSEEAKQAEKQREGKQKEGRIGRRRIRSIKSTQS